MECCLTKTAKLLDLVEKLGETEDGNANQLCA